MDRLQLLLVGLPLFLFAADVSNLFLSHPPATISQPSDHVHRHPTPHPSPSSVEKTLDFPSQRSSGFGGIGVGHAVTIDFCSSCSFRGTAVTLKKMLETQFPGIDVALANYPPSPPKRLLSKLVPVFQVGTVAVIMAGDKIFPRLGITPPSWYYTLRSNRFGTISAAWLLGNFVQSFLQSSGAFEVSLDGQLVFSKLEDHRFPGEIELRDLVSKKLANTRIMGDI